MKIRQADQSLQDVFLSPRLRRRLALSWLLAAQLVCLPLVAAPAAADKTAGKTADPLLEIMKSELDRAKRIWRRVIPPRIS
jgi:hypothetical protein